MLNFALMHWLMKCVGSLYVDFPSSDRESAVLPSTIHAAINNVRRFA